MNWIERRRRSQRRRRMLRFLLATTLGLGALLLVSLALPGLETTTGSVTLSRPREIIWTILIDLDGMPRWRSDLTRLERLPDLEGLRTWKETGPGGDRILQMVVAEPPRRLVVRNAGTSGRSERTIDLEETSTGSGTLVRLTEQQALTPLGRVRALLQRGATPRLLADLTRWLDGPRRQVASTP